MVEAKARTPDITLQQRMGKIVADRMTELDLNQAILAAHCAVSESRISQIVDGEFKRPSELTKAIAKKL